MVWGEPPWYLGSIWGEELPITRAWSWDCLLGSAHGRKAVWLEPVGKQRSRGAEGRFGGQVTAGVGGLGI